MRNLLQAARICRYVYDWLEYWRVRRIERRAGVRFWRPNAVSGEAKLSPNLDAN